MRLISDIFAYTSAHMPKFNSISISGYHMQEAGATPDLELAYTLADGVEYLRSGLRAGLKVDQFAPRCSFFFCMGMDFWAEVAKLRAARMLWAKLVKTFQPTDPRSLCLRTHCQTSGWSLTAQDPFNNVSRTCIEALAAALGHTQSLHTNALDEAIALPSEFSSRIARNTQLFVQEECDVTRSVDPLGGSRLVEQRTHELASQAWGWIQESEELGGMASAIAHGLPQRRIEEAACRRQALIDSGKDVIVGLNRFRLQNEAPLDVLQVDNASVLQAQLARLAQLKASRDGASVEAALQALHNGAAGQGNTLELAVTAARAGATVGEMSMAMEQVFGRHKATPVAVSGVYLREAGQMETVQRCLKETAAFEKEHGRRPRILVAKMGQDGHDRGAKVISAGFADLGFDVDLGPLFSLPQEVAQQALDNDVHIVGVSTLAGSHKTLIPQLIEELRRLQRSEILVVAGGVIPQQDVQFLKDAGCAAVFGPGTVIPESALELLALLNR